MASEVIFLGSGSSTGVPTPLCVLQPSDPPCSVCHKAIEVPPEENKNYRCNPSIMIRYRPQELETANDGTRYIQIDCGKCFREQVLRWYIKHRIPRMDALILTHEHADAILGLDDIRGIQPFYTPGGPALEPTPVYVTQHTMDSVTEKFGYLVSAEQREELHSKHQKQPKDHGVAIPPLEAYGVGPSVRDPAAAAGNNGLWESTTCNGENSTTVASNEPVVFRRVTQLDWRLIQPSVSNPFSVGGLEFTPLPVMHGEDYIALGFEFGETERVVYMSDVCRIPQETLEYLDEQRQRLGRPAVLIVDALNYNKPHETHFSFPETLEAIKALQPVKAFMIGMTHQFDHEKVNEDLEEWSQRENIIVQLSYDGLAIPVNL